jgi:hypothetical protein
MFGVDEEIFEHRLSWCFLSITNAANQTNVTNSPREASGVEEKAAARGCGWGAAGRAPRAALLQGKGQPVERIQKEFPCSARIF